MRARERLHTPSPRCWEPCPEQGSAAIQVTAGSGDELQRPRLEVLKGTLTGRVGGYLNRLLMVSQGLWGLCSPTRVPLISSEPTGPWSLVCKRWLEKGRKANEVLLTGWLGCKGGIQARPLAHGPHSWAGVPLTGRQKYSKF